MSDRIWASVRVDSMTQVTHPTLSDQSVSLLKPMSNLLFKNDFSFEWPDREENDSITQHRRSFMVTHNYLGSEMMCHCCIDY